MYLKAQKKILSRKEENIGVIIVPAQRKCGFVLRRKWRK
jgi:hypothetical protein